MKRRSLTLATAIVIIGTTLSSLSGCSSSPGSVSMASFIIGSWKCNVYDNGKDLKQGYNITVGKDGVVQKQQFENGKIVDRETYQLSMVDNEIDTTDSSNGGWTMVVPSAVTTPDRFLVKINSINGGGTHEHPTIEVKADGHVIVDKIYQTPLDCVKAAVK